MPYYEKKAAILKEIRGEMQSYAPASNCTNRSSLSNRPRRSHERALPAIAGLMFPIVDQHGP